MKRSTIIIGFIAITLATAAVWVSAQTSESSTEAEKDAGMVQGRSGMMSMMKDMSNRCWMMSDNFDSLMTHFDRMMQIDDLAELKSEMQRHRDMMGAMHGDISEQRNMCEEMMSMMGLGGGSQKCMMHTKSGKSSTGGDHSHDH